MRVRNSALTESGRLRARDTEAVETPARAATALMPCFDDLPDCVSTKSFIHLIVTLHGNDATDLRACLARNIDISSISSPATEIRPA
jgi:hypothetical protein